MKKRRFLLPLALILFFHIAQAQLIMIDGETGEYRYEDVVQVKGITKKQIQERAKKWLNVYYKTNDSIQTDSSSVNYLSSFEFSWKFIQKTISLELFYDVTIKTKENRYKYDFSNFRIGKKIRGNIDAIDLETYINRFPKTYQIYIEEPIDTEITKAISSLEYFILNNKVEKKEDDW
jgi:Domain of unknown function (DUF4468) with TBP-like fold